MATFQIGSLGRRSGQVPAVQYRPEGVRSQPLSGSRCGEPAGSTSARARGLGQGYRVRVSRGSGLPDDRGLGAGSGHVGNSSGGVAALFVPGTPLAAWGLMKYVSEECF